MYNLDDSIAADFARASFNQGLSKGYSVYLSTKNNHPQVYDGRFKDIFQEIFDAEFKPNSTRRRSLRTSPDRRHGRRRHEVSGGYVWACKNYDGDVQSDTIAQGLWLAGLMTSVLMTPDGRRWRPRPPTGTVTRITRAPEGQGDLDQLDRLDLRLDPRAVASCQARRQ